VELLAFVARCDRFRLKKPLKKNRGEAPVLHLLGKTHGGYNGKNNGRGKCGVWGVCMSMLRRKENVPWGLKTEKRRKGEGL